MVLNGAPTKSGDMPCILPLLFGGLRLPGCPRGGTGRQGGYPAIAELRAGGANDSDVHKCCYLF
jgi:hypothetical protein